MIVLLTDFGIDDPWVGQMKGVILGIAPLPIVDLSHAIPPQDLSRAALVLAESWPYFPEGAVFVTVVDPGVGTARKPLVVRIAGRYFVGPDNGVCALVSGARDARVIPPSWGLPTLSRTFHGRDLFAPAAARLASGAVNFADADPTEIVGLAPLWSPCITHIDRFGNALTNVAGRPSGHLRVGNYTARVVGTYGEAAPGELVALTSSNGFIEFAVPNGSAAALGLRPGDRVDEV